MPGRAAAGASARIVVLHTAPDVSSLTLTLAEGAQLELTELFTAEAFAEVSVKQAARSRCRLTTAGKKIFQQCRTFVSEHAWRH